MSKDIKKPMQKTITIWGKDYLCQRASGITALKYKYEWTVDGAMDIAIAAERLINNLVISPKISPYDFDEPGELEDLVVALIDFQFITEEEYKELQKKSNPQ